MDNLKFNYVKIIGNNCGNFNYGLNTLVENFDSKPQYYCELKDVFDNLHCKNKICFLTIPADAQQVKIIDAIYGNIKYKSDKIYIEYIAPLWTLETIKFLVENGAIITSCVLTYAAINNHFEIVKYLVENGADIQRLDNNAVTAASNNGNLEIVKYLVEHGANIRIGYGYPIIYASEHGYLEIVKYLVENGANIHAQNDEATKIASRKGHLEVVKYLKFIKYRNSNLNTVKNVICKRLIM